MTTVTPSTSSVRANTPPSRVIDGNGCFNGGGQDVTTKRKKLINWKKEKPVAVLSIIGDSKPCLPNETIKMQLKIGLLELIKTANIWIITDEQCTAVREIAEEVIQGYSENSKSRVLLNGKDFDLTKVQSMNEHENSDTENCIKEHLKTSLLIIVVGGEENLFETAMMNLKRKVPVLVLDGSGKTANFICKGYRKCIHRNSEKNIVFSNTFKSEMSEAAKKLYDPNDEKGNTQEINTEKLARQLLEGLEENIESIHVYSASETTYTLDRSIQDILFKLLCTEDKKEETLTDDILDFVDLWNRPDVAEREIFNLEKNEVFEKLQDKLGEKQSCLSKLFANALKFNRIDLVRQVLEYILDKTQYKKFLDHSLEDLYENDGGFGGYVFRKFTKKELRQNNIVEQINVAVKKTLGRRSKNIFEEGDNTNNVKIDDIFKHLFIWAVFMNREDLAMLFWKKEDNDYICSALYASSLAQMLALNSGEEAFMDEKAALLESSRNYQDLAYNVMTELYCMHKQYALQLLVTEVKRYNSTTIFEITEKFVMKKFMGHFACQTKMNQIWRGRISEDTSTIKAIFCAVILIPILLTNTVSLDKTDARRKNEVTPLEMSATNEQEKKTNGTCTLKQCAEKWPNWMRKIWYFYTSPMIKCFGSFVMYEAMLIAFTLYVLTGLHPITEESSSVYDYLIYVFVVSTFCDETYLLIEIFKQSVYISIWIIFRLMFEIMIYGMISSSLLSRRFYYTEEDFCYSRIFYAITLGLLIINSVKFCLVTEYLGSKVLMIVKMLYDVIFFILIFAVVIFGVGVIYQATMNPNSALDGQLIADIVYMPYWQLYGELFLDRFEDKETNGTCASVPLVNSMNTVVLAVYMVVTHIIILNMLIAMLSHTFEKEQDNNHLAWKFDRFSLIKQYYRKTLLMPPLNTIVYIVWFIIYVCNKFTNNSCAMETKSEFKVKRTVAENKKLAILEKDAAYSYFKSSIRLKTHQAQKN